MYTFTAVKRRNSTPLQCSLSRTLYEEVCKTFVGKLSKSSTGKPGNQEENKGTTREQCSLCGVLFVFLAALIWVVTQRFSLQYQRCVTIESTAAKECYSIVIVVSLVYMFHILLEITLMESDTLSDDFVDAKTFDLSGLELNKVHKETFVFRQVMCDSCLFCHATRVTQR